ncbi:MAG: phosphotriesterase family protein [Dehalococcoidia bacterium]
MANVNTVLGPIATAALGRTLMHEHLLIGWPGWERDPAVVFDRRKEIDRAVERLQELGSLGVQTFVDPCPIDIGRDVEFAAEVASRSGMQIVCSTGMYKEELGMPTHFRQMDVDALTELYVRELTEGIGSTGIKAGIIKCATGSPISANEAKCLHAAARAAKSANVRVITHTDAGSCGPDQVEIFASEGLPLHHAAIGHSDGSADLRYHETILDRGCYLSFDRFGLEMVQPDRLRIAALAGLLAIGWGSRMLVSHDAVGCFLGRPRRLTAEMEALRAKWNYFYLFRDIFPVLREAGVPDEKLDALVVENPRRFFEGEPAA